MPIVTVTVTNIWCGYRKKAFYNMEHITPPLSLTRPAGCRGRGAGGPARTEQRGERGVVAQNLDEGALEDQKLRHDELGCATIGQLAGPGGAVSSLPCQDPGLSVILSPRVPTYPVGYWFAS